MTLTLILNQQADFERVIIATTMIINLPSKCFSSLKVFVYFRQFY